MSVMLFVLKSMCRALKNYWGGQRCVLLHAMLERDLGDGRHGGESLAVQVDAQHLERIDCGVLI